MYTPSSSSSSYGYGSRPGSTNPPQPLPFNPSGSPVQPGQPHLQQPLHHQQQQPPPGQQHHHQQQAQPNMYNPQQFAQGQSPPYGTPSSSTGPNAGAGGMGMMQNMPNNGMAHTAGPHVSPYQTPYSGSPYGASIPGAPNLTPSFMPPTSNAPSFQMSASNMNMNPQQIQRMQPHTSSTPTQPGPRASPYAAVQHNTPPNAGPAQSQFSSPQNPNQTPNNNQQSQGGTVVTPQTPNFPPGQGPGNAALGLATPLSPGSEAREKQRVSVLLDINRELLLEVMRFQAAQAESKREELSPSATSPQGSGETEKGDRDKADRMKAASGREYVECMRRLQSNLAYLAAIADRSHKPSSQIPPHPAIMTAPPIAPRAPGSSASTSSPSTELKKDDSEEKKHGEDTEEHRAEILKDLYQQLQALFPGVDPKKEQSMQPANPAARSQQATQMQMQALAQAQRQQQQAQGLSQGQPGQGQTELSSLQKTQNDLLRQRMMMQAQQNQQNMQANQQKIQAQSNQQHIQGQGIQGLNTQQQGQQNR